MQHAAAQNAARNQAFFSSLWGFLGKNYRTVKKVHLFPSKKGMLSRRQRKYHWKKRCCMQDTLACVLLS
jgi:hypothetical protein